MGVGPTTRRRRVGRVTLFLGVLALAALSGGCPATVDVDTCNPDPTVQCASDGVGGDIGYTCTGIDVTPPDSAGFCSPVDDVTYCCFAIVPTCMPDESIQGCNGTSTGWSCTGADAPDAVDTTLSCSIGVADPMNAGSTDYCCLTGDTFASGSCAADPSVTGCAAGSFGFSCASTDTPDQTDATLICSFGVADGTATDFCCLPMQDSFNTCVPDASLASVCTAAGSFGFRCTAATDDPTAVDPSLTCSPGKLDADGTSEDFCCTN